MAHKEKEIDATGIRLADGVQLEGESMLPHNHRLRAEVLAKRGSKVDPDGLITPELIADTADRLANESAAEKPAKPAKKPAADNAKTEIIDPAVENDIDASEEL